ncbi:MAG: glucose-6-phosphate isomerase [Lentisphaerales bacterium]|nr:glucose-6-phosphate isomerase [Lentisphaerales bacterium]
MNKNLKDNAAHAKLLELSKAPFDLTEEGALSKQRFSKFRSSAGSLQMFYGTQRVDENTLDALQELADDAGAVGQFKAMISGEVVNKIDGYDCENRQVLHTAVRNVFADLNDSDNIGNSVDAIKAAQEELEKLDEFCKDLACGSIVNTVGQPFTDMVLVGIGGSDLGPRAIYLALKKYAQPQRRIHFISNVDPDDAAGTLDGLDLSKTLVTVISKSGGTLETLTNETFVAERFKNAGLPINKHFVCVTGEGSPMDNPSKYLRTFYMFDYIGGRYSVTSMVGGVVLAFSLGYKNFENFLRGARKMDLNSLETDITKNLPLLAALLGVWNRNYLNCETLAVLPYSQALSRFAAHLQQCDMESNGKRINRQGEELVEATGPIVWGEPGTNGQHAFYQLIHQSETVVPCDFIGFRQSQYGEDLKVKGTTSQEKLFANLLAQSIGMATGSDSDNPNKVFPGNRPNSLIMADQLTPEVMGQLLAFYENKIAFQGFLWNINSFDQEGVQLGKVLANGILDTYINGKPSDESSPTWILMKESGVI